MPNYVGGEHIMFAGGQGEITNIENRPNDGQLLHVYTTEGQIRKLPNGLPHIKRIDSIVDRLAAVQSDSQFRHKMSELDGVVWMVRYENDRIQAFSEKMTRINSRSKFTQPPMVGLLNRRLWASKDFKKLLVIIPT
jgi:hypothetical protein